MPNWACGNVEVTGKRDGVIAFVNRFLDILGKTGKEPDTRFFARSFLDDDRESVISDVTHQTEADPENAVATVIFPVSFAWSAYSCVIDGYPQHNPDCITLTDACQQDHVSVHIQTEEPGIFFEEDIFADEHGNLTNSSQDLRTARCCNCGSTQGVASFVDVDDLECYECGSVDLELIEEE